MSAHLAILPILVPLLAGALLLCIERAGIGAQRAVSWAGLLTLALAVGALCVKANDGEVVVYLVGDWPARLGIALVADRLAVLMLAVLVALAGACLLHACAGWDTRAPHFHALFQFQLAGLAGAFLTGDLFNLFVFFEVMLIASYGLLASGGRGPRLASALHYVAFNVLASTLFLIALGLLYGLLGSLNMAELSVRITNAPPENLLLIRASAGVLLVVFCAKAAALPLFFWLPRTYARAPAAVAALFVIMTKVGLYAILRTGTLMFGATAGTLAGWQWTWLLPAGLLTLLLPAAGTMAATRLRTLAAWLVLASAGTLFVAFSLATAASISAGLYYLAHGTFAGAALFLLVDRIRRHRGDADDHFATLAPYVGRHAGTGLLFLLCAVLLGGLPPFSGFIGKLALLGSVPSGQTRMVWIVVLATTLMMLLALARAGTRVFWRTSETPADARVPDRSPLEAAAIAALAGYCLALTIAAEPVLEYTQATAEQLLAPQATVDAVLGTRPQLREPSP